MMYSSSSLGSLSLLGCPSVEGGGGGGGGLSLCCEELMATYNDRRTT